MFYGLLFQINLKKKKKRIHKAHMTKAANGAIDLDGDVAFSDLPHVESDCGNHVFTELTRLKNTKKRTVIQRLYHKRCRE